MTTATTDIGREVLPGATKAEIGHVSMTDIVGDYDTPDQVPEWRWVEEHSSFSHKDNGQAGVWEFVLNLALDFQDIPAKLLPVIRRARADNLAYLMVHQNT